MTDELFFEVKNTNRCGKDVQVRLFQKSRSGPDQLVSVAVLHEEDEVGSFVCYENQYYVISNVSDCEG